MKIYSSDFKHHRYGNFSDESNDTRITLDFSDGSRTFNVEDVSQANMNTPCSLSIRDTDSFAWPVGMRKTGYDCCVPS